MVDRGTRWAVITYAVIIVVASIATLAIFLYL
jgi:hypothetical protein